MKAITISPFFFFFFFFFFFSNLSPVLPETPVFAPVSKDPASHLYTITISLQTPPQPTKLHLSLSSSFTWLHCSNSTTPQQHILCTSPLCTSFHPFSCSNNSCYLYPENPITRQATLAPAILDCLTLPASPSLIPDFLFSCTNTFLLTGLADQVTGLAAFGRSNHSLPAQVSNSLSSPRIFALCLPSSTDSSGVTLLGTSGPYYFSQVEVSTSLVYTRLILNPVGTSVVSYNQQPSDEYYINLTSIQVNGKPVPLNNSQLVINENGYGGTKLSTDSSYTMLESSIYKAFVNAFMSESAAFNLSVASAVKPFDLCYEARNMFSTRVGPGVPTVDLVMERDDVFWRIFGGNSMVRIESRDVWCLGFVDGGINMRTPIVIGGRQMEDNLVEFDLDLNRFGFSSTLLLQGTTCSNFTSFT
ncbi:Eukaryotic aspartyl protease family protein [Euphorbia peplus]|nr:Eukaryotic aspartyl protease family protein [Euphorbia peplus]